jgi:hypothetical protein
VPAAGPPHLQNVVVAIACVLAGTLGALVAAMAGWRSRNWLAYACSLGCAVFALGVVGQRGFPSSAAIQRLGLAAARTSTPGPFDAGVTIPVVNLQMTPISLVGVLIAALGLSLVLIFESSAHQRPTGRSLRPLHDDDTI